jgi:hypothetical protein
MLKMRKRRYQRLKLRTDIEHGLPLAPITVELSTGIKDRQSAPGDFM